LSESTFCSAATEKLYSRKHKNCLTLERKHWNGPIEGSKQEYPEASRQNESPERERKRNGANERLNRIEKK
jgi:hypothetical protein